VNRQVLRGRGFFRTAFYFPSVTSSVAITVLWLFLFSATGAVNAVLSWVGIHGPNWFNDPHGIVQNLLGVSRKTAALRERLSEAEYNKVSVRVELQADCLAGLWAQEANRARPFLDPEDIDEALRAANAIGDDMLQRQARGVVVPDSFTHGSSTQRVRWFKTGFEADNLKACDTFSVRSP
jgi:hypothetical protein